MDRRLATRSAFAVVVSLAVVVSGLMLVSPAAGGEEETVTFRLTIRGTVVPTDTFGLELSSSTGIIMHGGIYCGPSEPNVGQPREVCEARSYDAEFGGAVGSQLTYIFWRDQGQPGDLVGDEVLHQGTITITGSPQNVTLVYDYSLDDQVLPDTALPTRQP